MNDLFKDLALEAIVENIASEAWIFTDNELEKFAELIVSECMRMCDVAAIGYETHGRTGEANGCYSAKEYIEEHFGVKE